jgi:hypothetical protein
MVYNRNLRNLGFVLTAVIAGKDGALTRMGLVLSINLPAFVSWVLLRIKVMEAVALLALYKTYFF